MTSHSGQNQKNATSSSHWTQVSPTRFERNCSGGENILGHIERRTGGHSELSIALCFGTEEKPERLLTLMKNAWIDLYTDNPEVAIGQRVSEEDDSKTILTYSLFENEEAAKEWVDSHLVIVKDSYEELFQRNMDTSHDTPDRRSRMEISFLPGQFNVCLHFSHVVVEAIAALIAMNHFIERVVSGNPDRVEYERLIRKESPEEIMNTLPVSTADAYENQYKPTEEEVEKGIDHWAEILQMHARSSISVPSDDGFIGKPLKRTYERLDMSVQDTIDLKKTSRTLGMAPWVIISGAYAKTIQEMYATGEEDGLMLTVPLGTNRWLDRGVQDSEGSPKRGAITSAQMNGHIWIDGDDLNLTDKKAFSTPGQGEESDKKLFENLQKVGKLIREQVDEQLSHPHMVSKAAQDSLFTTYMSFAGAPRDPNDESYNPWHPCFTIAGNVPIPHSYSGDTLEINLLNSNLGTRTLMNRLWMAIAFHNDCLRCEFYYNSKYFKKSTIEAINKGINEKVRFIMQRTLNPPRSSKL